MQAPHFMYVLVASGPGYFAEMAAVSATTLKRATPDARVTFITDEKTADLKTPATAILRALATDWVVQPVDGMSPVMASRFLKLSSRSLVKGDVVFLDCDTLIARDLTPLANHRGAFAVVKDRPQMPDHMRESAGKLGLIVPRRYFNSGVMGMRDTPPVRAAVEKALETWRMGAGEGFYFDQVFLNSALAQSDVEIEWLPPTFNAQIWSKTYHAIRPRIFHVFTPRFNERDETVLHVMAKGLKENGVIDEQQMEQFVATQNPWTELSRPGQYIALGRPVSAAASAFRLIMAGRL